MKKIMICPKCGSHNVIHFDADNDLCQTCREWFPAVGYETCHEKCKKTLNKEEIHHKKCVYYKGSISEHYDKKLKKQKDKTKTLKNGIKRVLVEINSEILKNIDKPNMGKRGCVKRLEQLLGGGKYAEDVGYGDKQC